MRCAVTRSTRSSSAYVAPGFIAGSRSKRGSLAIVSATRNLGPSFSSSAMTASVMHTVTLAYRQSISERMMSSLFWIEKLMKLVSINTWYGGPSALLWVKKRLELVCVTWLRPFSFSFCASSFACWFGLSFGFWMRESFGEIMRFVAANCF
eukprot:2124911-Prymnesium_polylepis.1